MKVYEVVKGSTTLDGLRQSERTEPRPRPHEVLIRVRATSINFRDHMVVTGKYFGGAVTPGTLYIQGTDWYDVLAIWNDGASPGEAAYCGGVLCVPHLQIPVSARIHLWNTLARAGTPEAKRAVTAYGFRLTHCKCTRIPDGTPWWCRLTHWGLTTHDRGHYAHKKSLVSKTALK
jgi:hypothetical protein